MEVESEDNGHGEGGVYMTNEVSQVKELRLGFEFMNSLLANLYEELYLEMWMKVDEDQKVYVPLRDYVQSQLSYFVTEGLYTKRRSDTLVGCKSYMESYRLGKVHKISNRNKGSFYTVFEWYLVDLAYIMLKMIVDNEEEHLTELTPTLPKAMWIGEHANRTRKLEFDWQEEHLTELGYNLIDKNTVEEFIVKARSGEIDLGEFIKRIVNNLDISWQNIMNPLDMYSAIIEDKGRKTRLMGKALVYTYISIVGTHSIVDEYEGKEI